MNISLAICSNEHRVWEMNSPVKAIFHEACSVNDAQTNPCLRASRRFLHVALWLSVLIAACPAHAFVDDELWAAANIDDVKRIAEIVNAGISVNCRHSLSAETALMAAASSGNVDSVKLLLTIGADPNIKDTKGKTALGMVRDREKAFSKLPDFAELVKRQRQVIAILEPLTKGGAASEADAAPLQVKPADPDMIARFKFESARAAMMAGLYTEAMNSLNEVDLKRISERNRSKAMAMATDLSMRMQALTLAKINSERRTPTPAEKKELTDHWKVAKACSEKVINSSAAAEDDRDFCKQVLKDLRKDHSELFQ